MLAGLGLEILGLEDVGGSLPDVEETGRQPVENARLKALHYYQLLERPVFSCDSGLFIDGLGEAEQPGVLIRRVQGERLDDAAMLRHYAGIAARLGGRTRAQYINSICLVCSVDRVHCHQGADISTEPFWLVDQLHERRIPGLPLDSISQAMDTGMCFAELRHTESSIDVQMAQGFRRFFVASLGMDPDLIPLRADRLRSAWR